MSDLRKETITGIVTQSKLYGIVESLVSHFNNKILGKQDKLTAGTGISISNNTISSTDYSTLFVCVDDRSGHFSLTTESQNLTLSDIQTALTSGRKVVLRVVDIDNQNKETLFNLESAGSWGVYFIDHRYLTQASANIRGFLIYLDAGRLAGVSYMNEYLARTSDLSYKQDTISDLSTIRSGAAKGATALQSHQSIKTINNTSLVGSGNVSVQPVISDLATIRSNASNGNTALTKIGDLSVYGQPTVVDLISDLSNIIVRDINEAPSLALRRLFVNAGAVYDENRGYYEMNGLTNITEEQMIRIYNDTYHKFSGHDISYGLYGSAVRTTFKILQRPTWIRGINGNNLFAGCSSLEVVNIGTEHNQTTTVRDNNCTWSDMTAMFANCPNLKTITGAIQPESSSVSLADCFYNCSALQTVFLLNLSQNVSFADSHYLSIASIATMIMRAATTPNIVITLAANVYTDAMANSSIKTALNGHKNVSLASA